jgi:hypothetical protein
MPTRSGPVLDRDGFVMVFCMCGLDSCFLTRIARILPSDQGGYSQIANCVIRLYRFLIRAIRVEKS